MRWSDSDVLILKILQEVDFILVSDMFIPDKSQSFNTNQHYDLQCGPRPVNDEKQLAPMFRSRLLYCRLILVVL